MKVTQLLRRALPVVLVAVVMMATNAFAQFSASLSGTVEDPSGAVISGATVTLTNEATQIQSSVTTGGSGFYRFSELPPGSYTVVVSAPSFEGSTLNNVVVAAETPRDVDVKLAVGKTTQNVTVSADDVPLLQTDDASIGTTISSEEITRQPIFGRDPYELLRLSVGTVGDGARNGAGGSIALPNSTGPGQSNFGVFQTENQIQVSSAGQRLTSNSYLIDGVAVDSLEHGGSAIITPNPESVASISVVTSDYDATDGRNVGAQVRTVTKSGSNALHGSLFFQYDEPGLNARSAFGAPAGGGASFDPASGTYVESPVTYAPGEPVENKQREYAASIGGPIIKDKLFWFASYEGVTNSNTNFANEYVPSSQFLASLASQRTGGIVSSELNAPGGHARIVQLLAPSCNNLQGGGAPNTCQIVGGGADLGSLAGGVGTYLPPNNGNPPTNFPNWETGNGLDGVPDVDYALVAVPARFRGNQFNGRVDWHFTQKDELALSFFTAKLDQDSGDASTGAQPQADIPFKPFNSSGTAVYIHTFTPTLINEARANYTRFADNQVIDSAGQVNWGFPRNEIQGYNFGRLYANPVQSPDTPGIFAENTYEVRDTVIKVAGSHTYRAGFQLRFEQNNDDLSGNARPDYVFQGIWNWANDAPIFEQVAASPYTGGPGNAQRYFRDRDLAFFVMHDWKVAPNFTVNMGLRWEQFSPLHNKTFETNNLVFGPPGNTLTQSHFEPVRNLYNSNNDNFGPKLGFAWQPKRDAGLDVVRGGFGISYDRLDDILFGNSYENGPGYFFYTLCCAGFPNAAGTGIVFEQGTSNSPYSFAPNPNLATGVNPLTNTPNAFNDGGPPVTPEIETYSALAHTPQPILYSYSLEVERQLPYQMTFTLGYQGSRGQHFPRLVDQNFLYPTATGTCLTGNCTVGVNQTPFFAAYTPVTDVPTSYNGLNAHLAKRFEHGYNLNFIYTFSKSLDTLSNEGPSSLSNQTDPADPRSEYGPSDFNATNHVIVDGLWNVPGPSHGIAKAILNGWQINGIYQYHSGFPYTPVTGVPSVALVTSAATISPTRPIGYGIQAGLQNAANNCGNSAFIHGTNFPAAGPNYFQVFMPGTTTHYAPGPPGIGRNSFTGPCYQDTDLSVAKQITFTAFGHESLLRFQANAFNAFNQVNIAPVTFGSAEATVENSFFGFASGADAGRVIDFLVRLQF